MKKLGKKTNSTRESIQAYSCSTCSCSCSCSATSYNTYTNMENATNSKLFSNVSWGN